MKNFLLQDIFFWKKESDVLIQGGKSLSNFM